MTPPMTLSMSRGEMLSLGMPARGHLNPLFRRRGGT
jgi:hypothetical protein